MIDLWAEIEKHQPLAIRAGFGEEWADMCREKTPEAARSMFDAALGQWRHSCTNEAEAAARAAHAALEAVAVWYAVQNLKKILNAPERF